MMKVFSVFLMATFLSASVFASGDVSSDCDMKQPSGVDVWPWSVARPFPWNNIDGYWKMGDSDDLSFVKIRVLSTTNRRKILSLQVYSDGLCSKPAARGTGFVDASEKNVVRSLLSDNLYRYQLMLAMFNVRDLTGKISCTETVIAASMKVIGRTTRKSNTPNLGPLDPSVTETQNMLLKKVTVDVDELCKNTN